MEFSSSPLHYIDISYLSTIKIFILRMDITASLDKKYPFSCYPFDCFL